MAYTDGELLQKYLVPQILNDLENMKMDFMSVIPNAPSRAIGHEGLAIHKVGNPIEVDWDKTDAYDDEDLVRFSVGNKVIPWSYFSTTPFVTDKEEIRTSILDRQGILRAKSRDSIGTSWMKKGLHTLAPADDTIAEMPFIETTGPDDGTGRLKMLVKDLVRYRMRMNLLPLTDQTKVYVALCAIHLNDVLEDALNYNQFKDIYVNTKNGEPLDHHGLNLFWNQETVYYAADNTKKAQGAVIGATDRPASIGFYAPHTTKAIESITSHYKSMSEDTRNNPPQDEFRYTGNAIVASTYNFGHGVIKSGTAPEEE